MISFKVDNPLNFENNCPPSGITTFLKILVSPGFLSPGKYLAYTAYYPPIRNLKFIISLYPLYQLGNILDFWIIPSNQIRSDQ